VTDDEITVDVRMHRSTDASFPLEVCTFKYEDTQQGLSISVPDQDKNPMNAALFDIVIKFPVSLASAMPELNMLLENFSLEVSTFPETLPALSVSGGYSRIHFEDLRVKKIMVETIYGAVSGTLNSTEYAWFKTFNGPIHLKDSTVSEAEFKLTNGNFKGSITADRRLEINAMNGPIDVNATLVNKVGQPMTQASFASYNNHIDGTIQLSTLDASGRPTAGGAFNISTTTTNGLLALNITDQPPASTLIVTAESVNNGATVHLPPSYEGTLQLISFPFLTPSLVETPLEVGRRVRRVRSEHGVGVSVGLVEWIGQDEEDQFAHGNGRVNVTTYLGKNLLLL